VTRRSGPRVVIPPSACAGWLVALALLVGAGAGSAQSIEDRAKLCHACHGPAGQSSLPETPSIGGQPQFFVVAQLFLFREGRRNNAPMTEAAKGLTNDDLRAFAEYVSRLPPPAPPANPPDPARLARGRALTRQHPCGVCHNPDFSGREQMPRLAHQREDYLLKAMREYKSGARIGYAGAMATELQGLSDDDLRELAYFFSHLPPAPK
jgi:cytochrome c553